MPTATFPARILVDYAFYENVIKKSNLRLMTKLMYINARSLDYKRMQANKWASLIRKTRE